MQSFPIQPIPHSAKLNSSLRKTAFAAVFGTGLLLAAATSHAQIIYSGMVNLNIPTTTNGLYLNVVSGANNLPASTVGGTVPGWDINIWSATGLGFFNPAGTSAVPPGAYVVTAPGFASNLSFGTSIGGTSTFGTGTSTNVAQWNLNSSNNLFGFQFIADGGTLHYGWGRISLGATPGTAGRALVEYAFDLTPGMAIQAGVIPEPGTYALMGLGLAGLLLATRRRKQA